MKIYEKDNPCFLADTYVFGEVSFEDKIYHCYVKVNCRNKIEEIGTEIQERFFGNWSIEKIIEKSRDATKLHKSIFRRFDTEYWCKLIKHEQRRSKL